MKKGLLVRNYSIDGWHGQVEDLAVVGNITAKPFEVIRPQMA